MSNISVIRVNFAQLISRAIVFCHWPRLFAIYTFNRAVTTSSASSQRTTNLAPSNRQHSAVPDGCGRILKICPQTGHDRRELKRRKSSRSSIFSKIASRATPPQELVLASSVLRYCSNHLACDRVRGKPSRMKPRLQSDPPIQEASFRQIRLSSTNRPHSIFIVRVRLEVCAFRGLSP